MKTLDGNNGEHGQLGELGDMSTEKAETSETFIGHITHARTGSEQQIDRDYIIIIIYLRHLKTCWRRVGDTEDIGDILKRHWRHFRGIGYVLENSWGINCRHNGRHIRTSMVVVTIWSS